MEAKLPFNLGLHNDVAIDTCVENFSGTILKALAASNPRRRPHDNPRAPIQACIQDEIRLNNQVQKQWQITRNPALKAENNCLQRWVTCRLNE
jgi:hypothetical protein